MCGLVGIFGKLTKVSMAMFDDLFTIDMIRGNDGHGVNIVQNTGKNKILKDLYHPHNIIYNKPYRNFVDPNRTRLIMGHNRWATVGGNVIENTHPFKKGHIIGMHNGTLLSQFDLPDWTKFKNDSENLIHSINKWGIEKTWLNTDGAATLLWWDKRDQTLNVIRNSQRPFLFAYSKDKSFMAWASEKWMLEGIFARHNLQHPDCWEPKPNIHFKWKLDDMDKPTKVESVTEEYKPFTVWFRSKAAPIHSSVLTQYGTGMGRTAGSSEWDDYLMEENFINGSVHEGDKTYDIKADPKAQLTLEEWSQQAAADSARIPFGEASGETSSSSTSDDDDEGLSLLEIMRNGNDKENGCNGMPAVMPRWMRPPL